MVCGQCGYENDKDASICASCGAKLQDASPSDHEQTHDTHRQQDERDTSGESTSQMDFSTMAGFDTESDSESDTSTPELKTATRAMPASPQHVPDAVVSSFSNVTYGVNSGNLANLVNTQHAKQSPVPTQPPVLSAHHATTPSHDMPEKQPKPSPSAMRETHAVKAMSSPIPANKALPMNYGHAANARYPYPSPHLQQNNTSLKTRKDWNPVVIVLGILTTVLIVVCITLVFIIQRGLWGKALLGESASTTASSSSIAPSSSATVFDKNALDTIITDFSSTDAAVAGKDITGSDSYSSPQAQAKFVAAGLYLPIYLNAHSGSNPESISASDTMMNTMSNDDANAAMNDLGGPSAVTDWLHKNGYPATTIGRNFADVAASNKGIENYSSAADSVAMLSATEKAGGMSLMTYNIEHDGVSVPDGMQIAAHRGQGIKNAYNYFLIITDKKHVIALAVLTRNHDQNSVTSLTSKILDSIDTTARK